jgi:hypothetical protein
LPAYNAHIEAEVADNLLHTGGICHGEEPATKTGPPTDPLQNSPLNAMKKIGATA